MREPTEFGTLLLELVDRKRPGAEFVYLLLISLGGEILYTAF